MNHNRSESALDVRARDEVRRVPHYGIPISGDVYDRAARLLADMWRTGETHGVRTGDWDRAGFELAEGCLHAASLAASRPRQ